MAEYRNFPKLMWESEDEYKSRLSFIHNSNDARTTDNKMFCNNSRNNMGFDHSDRVSRLPSEFHQQFTPTYMNSEINQFRNMSIRKVNFVKPSSDVEIEPSPTIKAGKFFSYALENDISSNGDTKTTEELVPGFVLVFPGINEPVRPHWVLHNSAQKVQAQLSFVKEENPMNINSQLLYLTTIYINDIEITEGFGITRKESIINATFEALEKLKLTQPIIYENTGPISHNHVDTVTKDTLFNNANTYNHGDKIDEDNIGNKLLRKMGWSGVGGIGKKCNGIAEPILVTPIRDRKGIGHKCEKEKKLKKTSVREIIDTFLDNSEQDSIKFSTDLSSHERKVIHQICNKYNLKHQSFGKDENRYLVVSKE